MSEIWRDVFAIIGIMTLCGIASLIVQNLADRAGRAWSRRPTWFQIRRELHYRGHHQLCKVGVRSEQVVVGRSFEPQWLVNADNGEKLDITTFGGMPIYETRHQVIHG